MRIEGQRMIRIVIADDHAGIRYSISRLLKKQSDMAVVGEAENGARAIELVEAYQPDILLLDIEMPVMSGIEVARILEETGYATKIIILSNYSDQEFVEGLLELGAQGYIAKDEAPDYLPIAICEVQAGACPWLSPRVHQAYA